MPISLKNMLSTVHKYFFFFFVNFLLVIKKACYNTGITLSIKQFRIQMHKYFRRKKKQWLGRRSAWFQQQQNKIFFKFKLNFTLLLNCIFTKKASMFCMDIESIYNRTGDWRI
ncbi:hypothetical protein XENTR_v10005472 [Xenopus tropicalis]|nr:hypothetical protein XENTR_v10005472 [Xenopus tropicalis]